MYIAGYEVIPHKNYIELGCQKITKKRILGFLERIVEINSKKSPLFCVKTICPEISELIQKEFFARGYTWCWSKCTEIMYTNYSYIYTNNNKAINASSNPYGKLISLEKFLSPEKVDRNTITFLNNGLSVLDDIVSTNKIRQILKMMDKA